MPEGSAPKEIKSTDSIAATGVTPETPRSSTSPTRLPHIGHHTPLVGERPIETAIQASVTEPIHQGDEAKRIGEEAMARIKAEGGTGTEPPESKLHYTPAELEALAARSGFDPDNPLGKPPQPPDRPTSVTPPEEPEDPRLAHGLKEYLMMAPRTYLEIRADINTILSRSPDGTFGSLSAADQVLLRQANLELGPRVLQGLTIAGFGGVYDEISDIYRTSLEPQSPYGGDRPDEIIRRGRSQLLQEAQQRDLTDLETDPNLRGGLLAYVVTRAFQRMRGDPSLPPDLAPWEWNIVRVEREIVEGRQEARQARLETDTFYRRPQGYYLELSGNTPQELRLGVENWIHGYEITESADPEDILRDVEYIRKIIVEKGKEFGMTDEAVFGLLKEAEVRAYAKAADYFISTVPEGSIAGYVQLWKKAMETRHAFARLEAGALAYDGDVVILTEMMQWGRHYDGRTDYDEYFRPEKKIGDIEDDADFTARMEEVKRMMIARKARMRLRPKEDAWRMRMDDIRAKVPAVPAADIDIYRDNEAAFEAAVQPVEDKISRTARRRKITRAEAFDTCTGEEKALFRLGQWMMIRRFGDPKSLLLRDQKPAEMMQLVEEESYDQELDFIITQQGLGNRITLDQIREFRREGELPPPIMAQIQQLHSELLNEALARRGGDHGARPVWLTGQERIDFDQRISTAQTDQERTLILQERAGLEQGRRDREVLLGELLLLQYEHFGLGPEQTALLRRISSLTPVGARPDNPPYSNRFAQAEAAFGVAGNLLNVTLISAHLGAPTVRLDNVQDPNAPERRGVKVGTELAPIEDIQRFICWWRETSPTTVNINGRQVRLGDIPYHQIKMLYLKAKLDVYQQAVEDFGGEKSEKALYDLIFPPHVIGRLDAIQGKHLVEVREKRAHEVAGIIEPILRAVEADVKRGVDLLKTQGTAGEFEYRDENGQIQRRSFTSIRTDLDLVAQTNNYFSPGDQRKIRYFTSAENREAASDPEHPYYHTAIARGLRRIEKRWGAIREFRAQRDQQREISQKIELERREYIATTGLAWTQFYEAEIDPTGRERGIRTNNIEMGLYTQPKGGKRAIYPFPFFLMNAGLVRRELTILPFFDTHVRAMDLDHGQIGYAGLLRLEQGIDPRERARSGPGLDDTDAGRYVGRVAGADVTKDWVIAKNAKIGDRIRTGQGQKHYSDLAKNFSQMGDRKDIEEAVSNKVKETENVVGATENSLSRIFLTNQSYTFLLDREYGNGSYEFAFDWGYYHAAEWGLTGPGRFDPSYAPFTPYMKVMLAPLPGEADNDKDHLHTAPNAIWILRGRKNVFSQ